MTVVTVLTRTSQNAKTRAFAREFGSANLAAVGSAAPPAGGWPAGARIVRGHEVDTVGVIAGDGTARLAMITDLDLNDPVTNGSVLLRAGRFPRQAGEALL